MGSWADGLGRRLRGYDHIDLGAGSGGNGDRAGRRADAGDDHYRKVVRAFTDLRRRRQIDDPPLDRPATTMESVLAATRAPSPSSVGHAAGPRRMIIEATTVDVAAMPHRRPVPSPGSSPDRDSSTPPAAPRTRRTAPLTRRPATTATTATSGMADQPAAERLPVRGRAGWASLAERNVADLLAVAVAAGALVAPWAWLFAVTTTCLVVGGVRSVYGSDRSAGASVVALPVRATRRAGRLLRPRSLVWLPVITARTVLAAVVLPAAVAGVAWFAHHGATGVSAAARLGAWTSGWRVAAALVCLMIVGGVGDGRTRRAVLVRGRTARMSDGVVTTLAAGALVATLLLVVAAPRLSGGPLSGADGLGWLPPRVRPTADRVRDHVVTSELDALTSCLSRRQGVAWTARYSENNPIDEMDVARLAVAGRRPVPPGQLATAALAADNQLAPWVEVVEVAGAGGAPPVSVDRRQLTHQRPHTEASTLAPATSPGRAVLAGAAPDVDRQIALACSAGPVL